MSQRSVASLVARYHLLIGGHFGICSFDVAAAVTVRDDSQRGQRYCHQPSSDIRRRAQACTWLLPAIIKSNDSRSPTDGEFIPDLAICFE
ncbi:hypothetical protein [Bradyrhizobium sp. 23]|uniref:hypothetical protein n=1 Tax=Bradyrhizobium sp. 23 TaxID=2782667 RepID=UPI001FF7FF2A|nr:hypothetical protein [Bradyrhizobium sp. 23]